MTAQTFQILIALAEAPRHGYAIIQEVDRISGGKIRMGPGTLYGALQRLVEEGLIEECDAPPNEAGERRRYYRLTRDGRKEAAQEAARMREMVQLAESRRLLRHAK